MPEVYVVVSKVKKLVKESGYRTGVDYIEGLSKKIEGMVRSSIARIQAEGTRKTLGAEDLDGQEASGASEPSQQS